MNNHSIYCNIPALEISIPIIFNNNEIKNHILPAVSERISGIRLPFYQWDSYPNYQCAPTVKLEAHVDGDDLLVQFNCQLFGDFYRVDLKGFHWDFWKVVIASLTTVLLSRNSIVAHAACIGINGELVLLPGHSGAGKSSLSFECLNQGLPVYASELCYLQNSYLIAGNAAASIDASALEHFQIDTPPYSQFKEDKVLRETSPLPAWKQIRQLYFPRVNHGKFHVRKITGRRARMLLYENFFSQLPPGQMIAHQTIPISPLPSTPDLEMISKQLVDLTQNHSFIIEGSPEDIVAWMKEEG